MGGGIGGEAVNGGGGGGQYWGGCTCNWDTSNWDTCNWLRGPYQRQGVEDGYS